MSKKEEKKKETNPKESTLQSEGWAIISSQFKDIIDRETSLSTVDMKLPPEEYKNECKARVKAKEIVESMISEAIGVGEFKNKKTNYS